MCNNYVEISEILLHHFIHFSYEDCLISSSHHVLPDTQHFTNVIISCCLSVPCLISPVSWQCRASVLARHYPQQTGRTRNKSLVSSTVITKNNTLSVVSVGSRKENLQVIRDTVCCFLISPDSKLKYKPNFYEVRCKEQNVFIFQKLLILPILHNKG